MLEIRLDQIIMVLMVWRDLFDPDMGSSQKKARVSIALKTLLERADSQLKYVHENLAPIHLLEVGGPKGV